MFCEKIFIISLIHTFSFILLFHVSLIYGYNAHYYILSGGENWCNKSFIRAIPSEQFKLWRPEVFDFTKKNYVLGFSDDDFDLDLPAIFGQNELSLPSNQIVSSTAAPDSPSSFNPVPPPPSQPILTSQQTSTLQPLVNLNTVRDCFKCVVCYDIKMPFMFCNSCARLIGCASCIGELSQCPLCRSKFEMTCSHCDKKENTLPTPVNIPGLGEIINAKNPSNT